MNMMSYRLAGAVCAFLALSAGAALSEELTFVTDGGSYLDAQKKAFLQPTEKKLGVQINGEGGSNLFATMKTQVESKSVVWDIVEVSANDCINGTKQGLFEKIDYSAIPNA